MFNNTNMMFMEIVKDEAMSIKILRGAIHRQNRTLMQAITI